MWTVHHLLFFIVIFKVDRRVRPQDCSYDFLIVVRETGKKVHIARGYLEWEVIQLGFLAASTVPSIHGVPTGRLYSVIASWTNTQKILGTVESSEDCVGLDG